MPSSELCVTVAGAGDHDDDLAELTDRASGGDAGAFDRLARRVEGRIRSWARRWSTDGDEADELTQLSLIRMHERIAQFDRRASVTSWLYRIVRNIAADRRRSDARRATSELRGWEEIAGADGVADAESTEHAERLQALLRSYRAVLSPRECQVFEMIELRGLPTAQVAERLEIAPATARVLLLRARRKVRLLILEEPADAGEGDRC